jgi:hypothetical protein
VLEDPIPPPPPPDSAPPIGDWEPIPEKDLTEYEGRWVDVEHGDAIPQGMAGGKIVEGGVRLELVHKKPKSKTDWNITFWVPKPGHMGSDNISGGCGLDPAGIVRGPSLDFPEYYIHSWCRGYGWPADNESAQIRVILLKNDKGHIRLRIGQWVDEVLKRP